MSFRFPNIGGESKQDAQDIQDASNLAAPSFLSCSSCLNLLAVLRQRAVGEDDGQRPDGGDEVTRDTSLA